MTTSTPNDPAICKHCNRAHGGGWNPRHLFEHMAADLAASRAASATLTRADRLKAAGAALEKCGLSIPATVLAEQASRPRMSAALDLARAEIFALISHLSDGADEPRYNAAMAARDALGKLWAVL